jgi:hypothetical protein
VGFLCESPFGEFLCGNSWGVVLWGTLSGGPPGESPRRVLQGSPGGVPQGIPSGSPLEGSSGGVPLGESPWGSPLGDPSAENLWGVLWGISAWGSPWGIPWIPWHPLRGSPDCDGGYTTKLKCVISRASLSCRVLVGPKWLLPWGGGWFVGSGYEKLTCTSESSGDPPWVPGCPPPSSVVLSPACR